MADIKDNDMLDADEAAALLEDSGVKPTAQRIDIARILFARPQHLSADQVLASLHGLGQQVSRATVYNTLGLFHRVGLVREVVVDPSRVFFDSTPGPHHHFYNVDTGELHDVDADEIRVEGSPTPPVGTELDGYDVIMRVRQAR